jgi:hypothetical protein
MANPALEPILPIAPTSPRTLAAVMKLMPFSWESEVSDPFDLGDDVSFHLGDLAIEAPQLWNVVANEPRADRLVASQQGHGGVEKLLRLELGNASFVAGMRDNQILVGSVDDPGTGANELVTVVA